MYPNITQSQEKGAKEGRGVCRDNPRIVPTNTNTHMYLAFLQYVKHQSQKNQQKHHRHCHKHYA